MEFLQEITLELNSNTAYTTVGAKQGDAQSRVIKIHITENGADWTIPVGVTASYRIRKPDGYAVWNDAVIDNNENVVYITLSEQSLAVAGRAYADVLFLSGTSDEKQALSTVSFIIIIMASPDIAGNITSSNEFSRILDITDDADVILNEAEAWAVGTKSGVPVIEDTFSYAIEGGTFSCNINEQIFRQYVGESSGYTRYFMFTCTGIPEGESENHWNVSQGDTTLIDINLADYGITITGTPLQSNIIRVVVTDSDLQYQNNAKYYAEQAEKSTKEIEDLTATSEIIDPVETGTHIEVEKEIIQGIVNLNFKIPKGDTGDAWYVHIKYASSEPTADADMTDTPSAWMGLYSGVASAAPTHYTDYEWYQIKGAVGDTGKGIESVTFYQSLGNDQDQYRIVFTDGTYTYFSIQNGSSIQSITKTATVGLVDTYTVLLTNGNTTTFTVTNAKSIASLTMISGSHAAGTTDTYRITYNDGDTFDFGVYNGANGTGSVSAVSGIQADGNGDVPQVVTGNGAPTASTVGQANQLYFDYNSSTLYICLGESGGTYSWQGAVATAEIADGAVTTGKLADGSVTGAKTDFSGGLTVGNTTFNGTMILSANDYGDNLPATPTSGRLFFKRVQ